MANNNQKDPLKDIDIKIDNNLGQFNADERTEKFVKVSIDLIHRGRYLTPSAKWLYVALRSFKNEKSGKTFPSYAKIMERSGLSRNAVAKGLQELEEWGWLIRHKSKGGNNSYEFCYPTYRRIDTNTEVGNQTYPTKELAFDWAKERRERTKKESPVNIRKGSKPKK